MKHIKLFERFTLEKDLFTKITEKDSIDLVSKQVDINDKYYKQVLLSYPQSKILSFRNPQSSIVYSCLYISIIEKYSNGIVGDNKLELLITLTDDDWFLVRMEEYEWAGSWTKRYVNYEYTETSYWKCDQIEGLMALLDSVNEDMWSFMTIFLK